MHTFYANWRHRRRRPMEIEDSGIVHVHALEKCLANAIRINVIDTICLSEIPTRIAYEQHLSRIHLATEFMLPEIPIYKKGLTAGLPLPEEITFEIVRLCLETRRWLGMQYKYDYRWLAAMLYYRSCSVAFRIDDTEVNVVLNGFLPHSFVYFVILNNRSFTCQHTYSTYFLSYWFFFVRPCTESWPCCETTTQSAEFSITMSSALRRNRVAKNTHRS